MLDSVATFNMAKVEPVYPIEGGMSNLNFMPNISIAAGEVLGQVSSASAAEVQTLDFGGTVGGGTFTLSITGVDGGTYTSSALAYNISNANLKIAAEALLTTAGYVGATVTIGGGACPTDATVTFGGTAGNWNMPLMTATSSLTGTDPTLSVAATTAGVTLGLWGKYDDGASDGRQTAKAISVYPFRTDNMGRIVFGGASAVAENGLYEKAAPAWFKGRFKTADLTGLDANGIADLGRLESGTLAAGVLSLV